MSDGDELAALARLAGRELAGAAGGIGRIHRAIAARAHALAGPSARPAAATHELIARGVYTGVSGASRALGGGAGRLLEARDRPALSAGPAGATALGILNGLIGDALEREESALCQSMAVRVGGRPVAPEPAALREAFPVATPRLAVFLHGLMETERAWRGSYGRRLAAELAITPVELRFNSGRHVSENGRALHELLEALVAAWPCQVESIALVGHSMGGLVARSACQIAAEEGAAWVGAVGHVVSLGTPHLGAPLAEGAHRASHALDRLPETRPLGELLRRRSAGIRDLRRGSLVDEDWRGRDPDALRAAACREVPLLPGATHCFVAATITRSPTHPLGRLLGDCLVLSSSASGRGRTRRVGFADEHGLRLGGAHHFALLDHPAVYARLRDWLSA